MVKRKEAMITDVEREERASRKRLRTNWVSGATQKDKASAINLAVSRLGGKKYSWMNQGPAAQSTGVQRAESVEATADDDAEESDVYEAQSTGDRASPEDDGAHQHGQNKHVAGLYFPRSPPHTSYPSSSHRPSQGNQQTPELQGPVTPPETTKKGEPAKKPEKGAQGNPIVLSSGEESPIVIPSRDASPAREPPAEKPRSRAVIKAEERKKRRAERAAKAKAEEEAKPVYEDPAEEEQDLMLFLRYAWHFIAE